MIYVVKLNIDQRPERIDVVSERVWNIMQKLGWTKDGRAELIEKRMA